MNLASLVDIPALIAPEASAVIDGSDFRTFRDLRTRVARGASLLDALGVGPGDRVALFATNSIAYIEALFATTSLGAVAVPLNFRSKGPELRHLLSDSGSRILLTEIRYSSLLKDGLTLGVEHVVMLDGNEGWWEQQSQSPQLADIAEVDDGDIALLLYTSGTTSLPKGVMLTHGGLTDYVMNRSDPADGEDHGRMLLAAPLFHIAGVTSTVSALYSGRTVVVLSQFEAGAWLDAVVRERVTHAFLVPTMLAQLLSHPRFGECDLSSLETITYGAAPMPPALILRALELFPASVGFTQGYGQTETNSTVTVLTPEDHQMAGTPEEIRSKRTRLTSVGRAVEDVEIRIVGEGGETLTPWDVGQVQLRTRRQMKGYWNPQNHVSNEQVDWLTTGDLGFLDNEGYLFLQGRSGDLIIRAGENISPEEIENVLFEHPDVVEAGVVGLPDEVWGERVLAVVVSRPGSNLNEVSLQEFCTARLASFKRPDCIVFSESLPRTATGKLLRRALPELYTV